MSDEISRDELARIVARNHAETQTVIAELKAHLSTTSANLLGQFDRYVLQRVYEAERAADQARIKRLEDEEVSNRRTARSAVLTSLGAVLAAIAVAVLTKAGGWT